jgi:tricorn protease
MTPATSLLRGRHRAAACLAALLALACTLPALARDGFYRFPALRGQTVVFTAEGDLWRVGLDGGRAERITTHPDLESRAALSPDGRSVAFSGAYERAGEAYLMPLDGGVPQRLTWTGQNPRVWGFTPAGEVLVTAPSVRGEPVTQLFAIDPRTLARRALPAGQASDGALSPDGQTLFFTRNGLRGDNVRAYRGGAMSRVWRVDLSGTAEAQPLLPAGTNSQRPMPYMTPQGLRVAFLDDRDGSVNLWSVDARGGDARQHTRHNGWDIRHASIDGSRVVYALGADLRWVDLRSNQDRLLPISLGGDADAQRARWVARPQAVFSGAAVAPDGQRVALSLRGRVATQGTGLLRRAELPVPADARCRDPVFSHDSQHVFALCDIAPAGLPAGALPELEVWRFAADGSAAPVQVTRGATVRRLALFPSPDGRWLAHTDLAGRISLTALAPALPAQGGRDSRVAEGTGRLSVQAALVWAPDSSAFVYLRTDAERARERPLLYVLASGASVSLASDRYDSGSSAFTPDGRWLYFLSDRSFAVQNGSPWGDRNLGPVFDRRTKVYALALQPGLRFPFQPRDELAPAVEPETATTVTASASAPGVTATVTTTVVTPSPARAASAPAAAASGAVPGTAPGTAGSARQPARPAIESSGLAARLFEVPLPAGNYTKLRTDGRRLYLLEADGTAERRTSLRTLPIESTGPTLDLFSADVNDFDLTPDGKRLMLVRRAAAGPQPGDIQLLDAGAKPPADPPLLARAQVRWADWQIATDPAAEWRQLFNDAWRLHRDHFYDPAMHATDWPAVRAKYAALLPRVGERGELNELLSQMVSEVGALHSQVFTSDLRRGADDIPVAGLGAQLSRVVNGFRVDRIYRSDPELPAERAPLAQAGVQPGEVITHLNGRPLAGVADISEVLRGQADRQVLLTLKPSNPANPANTAQAAERRVVVLPVNAARETQLRTSDWETGNQERVAARSDGRIGYLRLRAMGREDIATFAREFYAQLDREAIIIDVRSNNGGNIDSWVIEKLLRRAWAWWQPRWPADAAPSMNMQQTFRGQLAVLVDENTYSDGETFAEGIQRLKLGTLVGRRTSGAGVWLTDSNRLLDGGLMRAAELGQFALDGSWLIEGRGVLPDIDVDNPPRATAAGGDAQLDAAIDHLRQALAAAPVPKPQAPPRARPGAAVPVQR